MKLTNSCKITLTLLILTIIFALPAYPAKADTIIHESATLGPTGQTSGWGLSWEQFIGSRFYVNQQVEVTAIGGHLTEWTAGNLFGAIIALTGPDDLPDGSPFYSPEVVASTVFDPGFPSSDFRTPLSVTLQPGYYALVFGTDELGASNGEGAMPYGGQVDLPGASYFIWAYDLYWGWGWYNTLSTQARFVVEGISDYCAASGGCDEYISGVQVGTINNTGTGCDGYADYTHLPTTMEIGTAYSITVTNGKPYEDGKDQCGIWIDWNRDKDFDDPNETITVTGNPGDGPYTATITPPADANLGETRMRVRIVYNQTPTPCGNTDYGEVEDYTITVTSKWKYGGGKGTAADPYLIYDANQMNAIGADSNDWDKHFKLMADIDLAAYTGEQFNIIGTSSNNPFAGVFDGNNHTISNFTYTFDYGLTSSIGLFGYVKGPDAEVKNLVLEDPNVISADTIHAGTLMGTLEIGTITNCCVSGGNISRYWSGGLVGKVISGKVYNSYYSGSVTGAGVGGLVAKNHNGIISGCYSKGTVWGIAAVGGLVGESSGTSLIFNSYAGSNVTGPGDFAAVGGLLGLSKDSTSINSCYSVGKVTGTSSYVGGLLGMVMGGTVTTSFWDVNSSGQTTSADGSSKTTSQMQTQSTFTSAGWDFVGETANGTDDIWDICEETNYPKLAWQIPVAGDFVCPDGVEMKDFAVIGMAWLSDPNDANWNWVCDISDPNDNAINALDVKTFAENWLKGVFY